MDSRWKARPGRPGRPGPARIPKERLAAAASLLLASVLPLLSCGAPSSEALSGPAAEDVRAALDSGTAAFSHARWDSLLAGGVRDGLVDYRYFQRHRDELDRYAERVANADLASLAPDHLKALLLNAYNAYTIRSILEHPGVSSIRDIDGVWTERTHRVGGHALTLDQIEHNLLRPFFRDPRIHFAVNCASMSCAPLPRWAFTGDGLDAQLETRTRAFLEDTANVRIQGAAGGEEVSGRGGAGESGGDAAGSGGDAGEGASDGRLLLSRYFDWYGEDFTKEGWRPRARSAAVFVARYSRPEVAAFVRAHDGDPPVGYLDYDWSLNAAVPPDVDAASAEGGAAETGGAGPDRGAAGGPATAGGADAAEARGREAPAARGGWVADLRRWIDGLGPAAPVAYGLAYVVATVLFVPGSPLTIGAGVAFGLLWGTVLVSIASVVGASLAFLIARHLLRGRVESSIREGGELPLLGPERSRKAWRFVELVDRALGEKGWRIVALTRLSPALPFNVQNYAYGLTGVRFRDYVLASWIAMLPGTLLYVYVGAAGARVAESATGAAGWGRTALQVAGVLATLAVVVWVGRLASRALREAAGEAGPGGEPSASGETAADAGRPPERDSDPAEG